MDRGTRGRVLGRAFALRRAVPLFGRGNGQAQMSRHRAQVPASYSSSDSVTWACRQSQIFEGRRSRGKTGHDRMRREDPGAHMRETAILGGRNILSTFQAFPRQHFSNLPPIVQYVWCERLGIMECSGDGQNAPLMAVVPASVALAKCAIWLFPRSKPARNNPRAVAYCIICLPIGASIHAPFTLAVFRRPLPCICRPVAVAGGSYSGLLPLHRCRPSPV